MSKHLSDAEKKALRKRLVHQGMVIAQRLSDVLAGKDVPLAALGVFGNVDREQKKEDILRRYLAFLNDRRDAIDDPEGNYGVCSRCGKPIPWHELDQMPWADQCRGCMGTFQ